MAPYHLGDPPGAYACICALSVPWSKGGGRSPTLAKMVQVTTAAYESDEPSANNMTEHPVGTTLLLGA